jgi:hypothetical protein
MSREDGDQTLRFDKGLHKVIVAAIVAVNPWAVVLVADDLCLKSGFSLRITSRLLEGTRRLDGDMDKRKTGNNSTILFVELVASRLEPRDDLRCQSMSGPLIWKLLYIPSYQRSWSWGCQGLRLVGRRGHPCCRRTTTTSPACFYRWRCTRG